MRSEVEAIVVGGFKVLTKQPRNVLIFVTHWSTEAAKKSLEITEAKSVKAFERPVRIRLAKTSGASSN